MRKASSLYFPASPFHSTTSNVYAARYQITRLMTVRVNKALIKQHYFSQSHSARVSVEREISC